MLGDFITRCLVVVVAYAYPAFECYKTVEKNRVEIEQLRFWCQYWIIIATMTVFERFTDAFISWLPMYGEMKLGFIIYLWYPKTKGTSYVYHTLLRPYIAKYEKDIDRQILEMKARALDLVSLHFQSVVTYGQTTFFQILQYLAYQSTKARHTTPRSPKHSAEPTNTPIKSHSERMRSLLSEDQPQSPKSLPSTPKRSSLSTNHMISQAPKSELHQQELPRTPSVKHMVSSALKAELEQVQRRSETQSQTTEETTSTTIIQEASSTNVQESSSTTSTHGTTNGTNVEEPDVAETDSTDGQESSDLSETLRTARFRLRRSMKKIN